MAARTQRKHRRDQYDADRLPSHGHKDCKHQKIKHTRAALGQFTLWHAVSYRAQWKRLREAREIKRPYSFSMIERLKQL